MGQAVAGFYAIGLIGVCSALPIQSVNTGDRNVVLLGALMFLSFGAVIAGCVCCRRRKKGFEEFRNESGTPEANKTEYPIFRALSPESQRNSPIATPPVSNSNENLIEDEFDNNNGPISPADMENIENNNAIDYIQNQNEVGITIEPSPLSINRNLINAETTNVNLSDSSESSQTSILLTNLQDMTVTQSSTAYLQTEYHPPNSNSEDVMVGTVIINRNEHVPISTELEQGLVFEEPCMKLTQRSGLEACPKTRTQEVEIQIHTIDSANYELVGVNENKTGTLDAHNVCKEAISVEEEPDMVRAAGDEKNCDCSFFVSNPATPEEVLSIKSSSSGKSSEVNSVEEALRALDCAIAGENSVNSGEDDEGDLTDEDFECNNANFQNVIRQLLITDSVKRILPELTDDQLNDNLSKLNCLDGVRTEAEMLVDSILSESRRIIEEKEKCINNQTIVVQHCEVDEGLMPLNEEDLNSKLPKLCIDSPPKITPSPSVEDFLSFEPLDSTSTPCVQKMKNSNVPSFRFPVADDQQERKARRKQLISPEDDAKPEEVALSTTFPVKEDIENPNPAEGTFTFLKTEVNGCDKTFAVDKTFDVNEEEGEDSNTEYTHPGDPCTSKQALERDSCYPAIVLDQDQDQDQEVTSEDMTTVTPVNTPIELNYSNEVWSAMTKGAIGEVQAENAGCVVNDDNGFASGGWFLHPQANTVHGNETFEVEAEEEEETDLESTFEALRKQLAEVLPQPQGITGPAEYSDDEDDIPQHRTFDEYRSPLDASMVSLLEGDPTPGTTVQNEMFINYKRVLSPILEVSEEETCKTFVMNETKCLDSTSTGCVDTGEAIMGVSKALMASNDTLFNFEDTLGDREDVFSPRTPTRSEMQLNNSNKSGKSTEENSVATLDSEKVDSNHSGKDTDENDVETQRRRSPPRTIDLPSSLDMMLDSDVCSPEQQKTFSDGTNSSNTDHVSSDVSATVDHDTTFTTYTNDEKTCITVVIKEDERISEISEPEWGSTTSYGGYEMNSLTDVPSLDYNVNIDGKCEMLDESSNSSEVISKSSNINTNLAALSLTTERNNPSIEDNQQEDSGNSTHMSAEDRTTNSDQSLEDETHKCDHSMSRTIVLAENDSLMNQSQASPSNNLILHDLNLDDREKCRSFIQNEIVISSSQSLRYGQLATNKEEKFDANDLEDNDESISMEADGDFDSSKENKNPNIKGLQMQHVQPQLTLSANTMDFDKPISPLSYQKVQTNSQDAVIVDKKVKLNSTADLTFDSLSYKNGGMHENIFYKPETTTILPNKHHQTIINYNVSEISMNGENNEQHCLMVADEIIAHLSGEEDPWAEPLHNEISFTGPCTEIITSFTNEWDSDVDDSHSSEEFMYVRGTPTKEKISEIINNQGGNTNHKNSDDNDFFEYEGLNETDVWSSHEDKIPVADSAEDEISEGSSSEFEGEFVPSCWDSMATPARSALKSPDKSSSQPNKKRRSVAFKKQRYHSVYEYPRENVSLSPSYSEPYLYSRDRGSLYFDRDSKQEFNDGFTVSSSMRPFHGSQFNALCHTWPTDSDFSWSQIEDLGDLADEKKLASYTNSTSGRWPQNFDSIDLTDGDVTTENLEFYGNNRPDSGVGESAEMLSDRVPLGELCHTKSTLRLPLDLLPPVDTLLDVKPETTKLEGTLVDRLILPTPSCTGSMDSISSSSGSERHVTFSTFGKNSNNNSSSLNIEINETTKKRPKCNTISTITRDEQLKPALILIENGPIEFPLGSDKIKQSDSTDEDSGIESIMKVNKECN